MNYKDKQGWLEAVMADPNLSPATKVYAYGIFQHMYGNKDSAWPGAKAINETTGLNDGHFWRYNKSLREAGYLEVTARSGRSNEYVLALPTSSVGGYPPPMEVDPPREAVTPTACGGTNTTKKTTKNPTKEDSAPTADAAVARYHFVIREDSPTLPNHTNVSNPVYVMDLEGVTGPLTAIDPPDPAQEVKHNRILTPGEQRTFEQQVRTYRVDDDKAAVALAMVKTTHPRLDIDEAITQSLRAVGVTIEEEVW